MFEFLFKYPPVVFAKGRWVLLGTLPLWVLGASAAVLAGVCGYLLWRRRGGRLGFRAAAIWALQSALLALLLLLLWQPAISVSSLKTQQNVVAVVVDDSRSMAVADGGRSRRDQAIELIGSRAFH
ncbi:MAG: hypothetical protein AAB654_05920, partial [Acidobacteriota bacterium]